MVESKRGHGRFGFTTCYDYLFSDLLREYALGDGIDAVVQLASWRAAATRDYAGMNVRSDSYYGDLWDKVMAVELGDQPGVDLRLQRGGRARRQRRGASGAARACGRPSGMNLIQASHFNEELLIVHNLDIHGARDDEHDEFNYAIDFKEIYRPLENSRGFTREIG